MVLRTEARAGCRTADKIIEVHVDDSKDGRPTGCKIKLLGEETLHQDPPLPNDSTLSF
jgi:hypothetical protein